MGKIELDLETPEELATVETDTTVLWSIRESIAVCFCLFGCISDELVDLSFITNEMYVSLNMEPPFGRVQTLFSQAGRSK